MKTTAKSYSVPFAAVEPAFRRGVEGLVLEADVAVLSMTAQPEPTEGNEENGVERVRFPSPGLRRSPYPTSCRSKSGIPTRAMWVATSGSVALSWTIRLNWPGFKMTRTFRGKRVKVEVQNPSGVNKGIKSLTVDGVAIAGEVVPTEKIKHNSKIVAVLG